MAPSHGTSRSSLTLENLEYLPKNDRSVGAFVHDQRRNARLYANEVIVQSPVVRKDARPSETNHKPLRVPPGSPLLKSRLEMQKEASAETDATPGSPKKSRQKDLFKGFKHARGDSMDGKAAQKASNKPKRARSSSDDDEERSARLEERRDRKRARHDIIKPKPTIDIPEQSVLADSDIETRREKKKRETGSDVEQKTETELTIKKRRSRGKAAQGIALMETFTANNVKRARLTLQPQNPGRLFKQARSGVTIKLGGRTKESERTRLKASKSSGSERKSTIKLIHSKYKSKEGGVSSKGHKTLPLSLTSTTGTSDVNSDSASHHGAQKVNVPEFSKKPHIKEKSSVDKENEVAKEDEDGRYSEPWDIGSELPSRDYSIRPSSPLPPQQPIKSAEVGPKSFLASAANSEPTIMTMATLWNLEAPQGSFGRFEVFKGNSLVGDLDDERDTAQATSHEHLSPARSRFFFSPLVPIPVHIKQSASGNAVFPDSALRHGRFEEAMPGNQTGAEREETMLEEEEDEYCRPSVREPSPVDSLDRLLHEHDAEDALYGHLFTEKERRKTIPVPLQVQRDRGCIQEYDQGQEQAIYMQVDDDIYPIEEEAASYFEDTDEGVSQEFVGYGDGDKFAAGDEPVWEEEYDYEYLYENQAVGFEAYPFQQENYECTDAFQANDLCNGEDFGDERYDETIIQDDEMQEQEEVGWSGAPGDRQADVLPFAGGRALLLGLGDHTPLTPLCVHSAAQRTSTYGRSVQEIEVMAARQLGHYW